MAAYTAIDDPEAYFQVVIYTGDGSSQAVTLPGDTAMQPDLVWIKNRDENDQHCWFDSVRGATKLIGINSSDAQTTDTDTLDSFTSDGFQVDADVKVNTDTENYVAWCWKESATAGFDMVEYSGTGSATTFAHSLSAVPHLMIVKEHSQSRNWSCYHHKMASDPETDYLVPSLDNAIADNSIYWNDTAPTSSVFSVGTQDETNQSQEGLSHIMYLWTGIQGFSKFGTYQGNGNADGTFVYTGFRPAFIIRKMVSGVSDWAMADTGRSTYNQTTHRLYANGNNAEGTEEIDILSNGWKERGSGTMNNDQTFVYMAWAEAPFVNSNGVPCNAR